MSLKRVLTCAAHVAQPTNFRAEWQHEPACGGRTVRYYVAFATRLQMSWKRLNDGFNSKPIFWLM